jgi:PTH1 family peptidyl-tRNA hydrolase
MKLIIGLGNPGRKYKKTRHNLGFKVVEKLAREMTNGQWLMVDKFRSLIIKHKSSIILAKPQTMMNNSGVAVAKLANFYHLKPAEIWIIHDDLDLSLGKIKIVQGRGSAGHKGVTSIIKELETNDFVRFRLGIGRPHLRQGFGGQAGRDFSEQEAESYVLSPFKKEGKSQTSLIKKAVAAIQVGLEEGIEVAMNRFN